MSALSVRVICVLYLEEMSALLKLAFYRYDILQ